MKSATVERCVIGYKATLIAVEKKLVRRRIDAHEVASMLVEVFEDRSFRADCGNIDDFRAAEALDKYALEACALPFLAMRAVLERHPNRRDWEGRPIVQMYADIREAQKAALAEDKPAVVRHRVTREQYDAVKDDLDKAEYRAKAEATRADEVRSELSEAHAEIARLKDENAKLRGRIEQLESLLAKR